MSIEQLLAKIQALSDAINNGKSHVTAHNCIYPDEYVECPECGHDHYYEFEIDLDDYQIRFGLWVELLDEIADAVHQLAGDPAVQLSSVDMHDDDSPVFELKSVAS